MPEEMPFTIEHDRMLRAVHNAIVGSIKDDGTRIPGMSDQVEGNAKAIALHAGDLAAHRKPSMHTITLVGVTSFATALIGALADALRGKPHP